MQIIFAGSGEFGLPSLKALRAAGHDILAIYTQPDRPAGRGRKLTPTPIAHYAESQQLPIHRTGDINAESLPPADAMVVIAFGQKIAPHVVNHPKLGCINLHASRLPKYRGAAPIHWAILGGETITGNSIIRLADKMDAGAVLAQSSIAIGELETTGELHDRLADDGASLATQVLDQLQRGTAVETPQDESQATIAKKLNRDASRIDFTRPAADIARQIRGLFPWPGCRVKLLDHQREIARLTLVRALAAISDAPNIPVGTLDKSGKVAAGAGTLEIIELQPEGKRAMPLREFQNGHPWHSGMRLEPLA
jgi:methionyl-tRNA formyltransferase